MADRYSRGEIAANTAARARSFKVEGGCRLELTPSAGAKNFSSNWVASSSGHKTDVDLEESPQAPGFQVACADEHLLAVGYERLRMQHRRVAEELDARVE